MSDETRRVLDLLAQGKVTVDEAHQLLHALNDKVGPDAPPPVATAETLPPRYLRINVQKKGKEGRRDKDVNIRVPLSIVRGGMRLGTLIPGLGERMQAKLRESGVDIDLTKVDAATIESLLKELGQLTIDVNEGGEQVRITCE